MIHIPGGTYVIGSRKGRADEAPEYPVCVDSFLMDVFPVTVGEVRAASKEKNLPLPTAWERFPPLREDVPATRITFQEAALIAESMGKRLPTEEEWEIAAGKAFGRAGPAHPRPAAGPLELRGCKEARESGLQSPEGLVGLVGMIWQWTATKYNWYNYSKNDLLIPFPDFFQVVRGGIWSSYDSRVSFRSFRDPAAFYSRVGIRCVKAA